MGAVFDEVSLWRPVGEGELMIGEEDISSSIMTPHTGYSTSICKRIERIYNAMRGRDLESRDSMLWLLALSKVTPV